MIEIHNIYISACVYLNFQFVAIDLNICHSFTDLCTILFSFYLILETADMEYLLIIFVVWFWNPCLLFIFSVRHILALCPLSLHLWHTTSLARHSWGPWYPHLLHSCFAISCSFQIYFSFQFFFSHMESVGKFWISYIFLKAIFFFWKQDAYFTCK